MGKEAASSVLLRSFPTGRSRWAWGVVHAPMSHYGRFMYESPFIPPTRRCRRPATHLRPAAATAADSNPRSFARTWAETLPDGICRTGRARAPAALPHPGECCKSSGCLGCFSGWPGVVGLCCRVGLADRSRLWIDLARLVGCAWAGPAAAAMLGLRIGRREPPPRHISRAFSKS